MFEYIVSVKTFEVQRAVPFKSCQLVLNVQPMYNFYTNSL